MRTATVDAGYSKACERRRELLAQRSRARGMREACEGEELAAIEEELNGLSQRLKLERRQQARQREERLIEEIGVAYTQNETAECMKLSRMAATCRFGPKKRDSRIPIGSGVTKGEWRSHLEKRGKEGA